MAAFDKSLGSERKGGFLAADWASLWARGVAVMPKLSRYTLVSVAALALDFSVYLALVHSGWHPTLAGIVGYALGLVLHYSLSVRFVFDAHATQKSMRRTFTEFTVSGIVGLGMTASVIWVATSLLGVPAIAAKGLAVATSFLAVFVMRHAIVFAPVR